MSDITEKVEDKEIKMPSILSVSTSPHIKSKVTTQTIMLDVVIALLPALAWGIYVFGIRALWVALISVGSAVLFEGLFQYITKRPITVTDLSAVVTGLLIALNVSVSVPIWLPVVGSFFAIVVVKQIFGGIGKNIVNPALAARVFMFAWPSQMGEFVEPLNADAIATATSLASLKSGTLPEKSILDMFLGRCGGCIGEVSALLLLVGGLYLIIKKVISWHIPVSFIGTVALLTFIFPKAGTSVEFMLYELVSGGLMIGSIFMATDYTTSPITNKGKLIFGVGCGIITVFIRYFGSYPEGVSFAILIMNLLVWYIDKITVPTKFGGKKHAK